MIQQEPHTPSPTRSISSKIGKLILAILKIYLVYIQGKLVSAFDPNAIFGPTGFGPNNVISSSAPLTYQIDFQNAAPATAPAQHVEITQQLASNLDWSTFRLTVIRNSMRKAQRDAFARAVQPA